MANGPGGSCNGVRGRMVAPGGGGALGGLAAGPPGLLNPPTSNTSKTQNTSKTRGSWGRGSRVINKLGAVGRIPARCWVAPLSMPHRMGSDHPLKKKYNYEKTTTIQYNNHLKKTLTPGVIQRHPSVEAATAHHDDSGDCDDGEVVPRDALVVEAGLSPSQPPPRSIIRDQAPINAKQIVIHFKPTICSQKKSHLENARVWSFPLFLPLNLNVCFGGKYRLNEYRVKTCLC